MLSKRKMIVLCSIAVMFVLSAAIAATASAAPPEFTVTTSFKGTGGEAKLKTESGSEIKCVKSGDKGNVTALTKIATGTISFTECTAEILGKAETCGNVTSGTINTNELEGTLGYTKLSPKEVGLLIKAKAGLTSNLAEFECVTSGGAKTKITVTGSVIGGLTPINTKTKNFKLKLEALGTSGDEPFLNKPTHFVKENSKKEEEAEPANELLTKIGAAAPSMSSIVGEASVEAEKEGEIKA